MANYLNAILSGVDTEVGDRMIANRQAREARAMDLDRARKGNAITDLIGRKLAAGDYAGARTAAYRGGDLRTGAAIDEQITGQNKQLNEQQQAALGELGTFATNLFSLPKEQWESVYQAALPQIVQTMEDAGLPHDPDDTAFDPNEWRALAAQYGKGAGGANGETFGTSLHTFINPETNERRTFQASSRGGLRPVNPGPGFQPAPRTQRIDAGTHFEIVDERGNVLRTIPKSGSLSSDQKAVTDDTGRVVAAEPVPGSKLDIEQKNEQADKERKRLVREKMLKQAGQTVLRSVTRALDDYLPAIPQGDSTASAASRIIQSKIPGTDEYNLVRQITDFQRNIGIDKLQQMRESSPTGGALGQVPVQQQIMLQETLGSFDIGQPVPVIRENLRQLNNVYLDIMFGSADERAAAIRDGRMTPQQNAEIEKRYYDTEFNTFGRRGPEPEAFKPPDAAIQYLMQNPGTAEQFDAKYGEGASQRILGARQ